jgi:hypothetical protein
MGDPPGLPDSNHEALPAPYSHAVSPEIKQLATLRNIVIGRPLLIMVLFNTVVSLCGGCYLLLRYPIPVCISNDWTGLSQVWWKVIWPSACVGVLMICRRLCTFEQEINYVDSYAKTYAEDTTFGLAKGNVMLKELHSSTPLSKSGTSFNFQARIQVLHRELQGARIRTGPYARFLWRNLNSPHFQSGTILGDVRHNRRNNWVCRPTLGTSTAKANEWSMWWVLWPIR